MHQRRSAPPDLGVVHTGCLATWRVLQIDFHQEMVSKERHSAWLCGMLGFLEQLSEWKKTLPGFSPAPILAQPGTSEGIFMFWRFRPLGCYKILFRRDSPFLPRPLNVSTLAFWFKVAKIITPEAINLIVHSMK